MAVQTTPKKAHELSVLSHLDNVGYDGFRYEPFDGSNPFHAELYKSKFSPLRRWLTADGYTDQVGNLQSGNNSRLFDGVQYTIENGVKVYHDLVSVKSLGVLDAGKASLDSAKIEIGKGVSAFESKALIIDGGLTGKTTFKVVLVWFTYSSQTKMWFDMVDLTQVIDYSEEAEKENAPTNVIAYAEQFGIKRPNSHFCGQDTFYFTAKKKNGTLQKGRIYTGVFLKSAWVKAKQIAKVDECSAYYAERIRTAERRRERKGQ